MTPRRLSLAACALLVLALLVVGVIQLASGSRTGPARTRLTAAQVRAQLAGSAAPLAALHAQAGMLLGGGAAAMRARLRALRGLPIVVNKWASWCEPCRAEFGAFQGASVHLGRKVAFIGIDSADSSRAAGLSFLRSTPVGYPSYYDGSGALGSAITGSPIFPASRCAGSTALDPMMASARARTLASLLSIARVATISPRRMTVTTSA